MNYLGLNKEKVDKSVNEMNTLLANYHIYYQNLRNFHWNVSGDNFFALHEKFEALYEDARVKIDEIAERILTLRRRPVSRLSEYLVRTNVEESKVLEDDEDMVDKLLEDHKILISNLREVLKLSADAGDEGSIDMMGGFLENLEKESWMLDAWRTKKLKRKAVTQ